MDRPAIAFYDGACGFCRRTRGVLARLDVFHAVTWKDFREPGALAGFPQVDPDACERALQLVVPGRPAPLAGFAAFRWLAGRLPVAWPLVPVLHLPGAGWLGERAYAWVAERRFGLGCSAGGAACRLPGGPRKD
ncbi:MAG: DUF393 domain-containing protein [Candidatus Sericytochromatia bacterium]|nr:DUF393 domain-containing protein [Candidatus Tanganyikabacteria bacterium]